MTMYPEDKPKEEPQKIDFELSQKVNEDQRKILMQLVEVMGVKELSARTDRLEQSVEQISQAMNQLIESNNKLVGMISNNAPTTTIGTATLAPNQFDKIAALGEVAEKLASAWNTVKGNNTPQSNPFGIDPTYVQDKIKQSFMSNIEIGEMIQENLKSKLTQKAITQVMKDSITHEPA